MGNVPAWGRGTKGESSLGGTQQNKVRNEGDLPRRERTASRWQSWPKAPSVTTWSWEPAALNASPRFPFPWEDIRCKDTALCQVTALQGKWDWASIPCAHVPGGRCPRKHSLQREPAGLLQFKGTLWNHVRAFKGKWNRTRVYLLLHSY